MKVCRRIYIDCNCANAYKLIAMKRMASSNALIVGVQGLGAEIGAFTLDRWNQR